MIVAGVLGSDPLYQATYRHVGHTHHEARIAAAETKGKDLRVATRLRHTQQIQEILSIGVVEEDLLSAVAEQHDVVDPSGTMLLLWTSHPWLHLKRVDKSPAAPPRWPPKSHRSPARYASARQTAPPDPGPRSRRDWADGCDSRAGRVSAGGSAGPLPEDRSGRRSRIASASPGSS